MFKFECDNLKQILVEYVFLDKKLKKKRSVITQKSFYCFILSETLTFIQRLPNVFGFSERRINIGKTSSAHLAMVNI